MTSPHKTTAEIREAFQKYFEQHGHTRVQSSSLVPHNDPTALFTNSGMFQFKDCFLGLDKRPYTRATSAQKCVRAGGKHNDLDNVGFTSRHFTFFEMLGNFSFGDYFKKDAIHFAWEFTTKVLGLPKDKLRVSVHTSDDEAADIWHKQEGVPSDRIVRFDADNFWQMADTGPCGPSSEIFWDQGKEVDGDRWLEFWNCVFMQYDRSAEGKLTPLPRPSVDTGMGLERMAAILQGVPSNYDIDLMVDLVRGAGDIVSQKSRKKVVYKVGDPSIENVALRVIADHLRSTSFLIADGVLPSNEGRGYVLRRILRRAVRFGKRLGVHEPFLVDLFPTLEKSMGAAYPELTQRKPVIMEILKQEEEKFLETLEKGLELLDQTFAKLGSQKIIPAPVVFKLYDTFGFPIDLTSLIAREKNLTIDEVGLQKIMSEAQEKSRSTWKGGGDQSALTSVKEWKNQNIFPKFTGYMHSQESAKVLALSPGVGGAWLAVDPTPFYGEGGGQHGDRGFIELVNKQKLEVTDSQKPYEGGLAIYVKGDIAGLKVGDTVKAEVSAEFRKNTQANHTATHLLHAALRKLLGPHVQQAGSLVTDEKLRFDFSHPKSISKEDLKKIEDWVNDAIEADQKLCVETTSYKEAVARGAMALFGEKYGDEVRMIDIPGFSTELCGGTHVSSTGDIRLFKIISESAVAAGTRRIEAITRRGAMDYFKNREGLVENISQLLKTNPEQIAERVTKLVDTQKELEREVEQLKRKMAQGSSSAQKLEFKYKNTPFYFYIVEDADVDFLRNKGDALRKAEPQAIHAIYSKPLILVTADPAINVHAGNFLKDISKHFGGRGGGQAVTAQGQIPQISDAQKEIQEWLKTVS